MKVTDSRIERIESVLENGTLKLVIRCFDAVKKATLSHNGIIYGSVSNICEPLDLKTLVFLLPKTAKGEFELCFTTSDNQMVLENFSDDDVMQFARNHLVKAYDNRLRLINSSSTTLANGISYEICDCLTKSNAPVKTFSFECKKDCWTFEVGTANDGYAKHTEVETVGGQALLSLKNGKNVVGATNADFFDINVDNAPSGLCVKNGVAIANPYSTRNFFGLTLNGEPVITNFVKSPHLVGQLYSAVGGREIFLKNGIVAEFSPLEPFSFIQHPRTCVGIKENGDVIVMVVDGRIPDYSNGASIIDLARLMQSKGAVSAINLDGGGSSTFLVKNADDFAILNRPADLYKPFDLLIRPIFNSIQIVAKK